MTTSRQRWFPLFASLMTTWACASSEPAQEQAACVPGQSIQCAGPSGCSGSQVCKVDGSGFDSCDCGHAGNTAGTGGAGNATTKINTGGAPQTTGLATGGSNAAPLDATGGYTSPAISTANCVPKSVTDDAYPAYVPARRLPGSCTEADIAQYYTDCYAGKSCAAFDVGGALAKCGACLAPTELSATAYGPLLRVGKPNAYFYETNVAGCEELQGETACAPKMQTEFFCKYLACNTSCPITDASGYYDALYRCMNAAQDSACADRHAAAICLTSADKAAACSGATFQEQFLNIAKAFCK